MCIEIWKTAQDTQIRANTAGWIAAAWGIAIFYTEYKQEDSWNFFVESNMNDEIYLRQQIFFLRTQMQTYYSRSVYNSIISFWSRVIRGL